MSAERVFVGNAASFGLQTRTSINAKRAADPSGRFKLLAAYSAFQVESFPFAP
jgi:hypothetical protein